MDLPRIDGRVDYAALRREQRALAERVRVEDDFEGPRLIGSFDAAYDGNDAIGALLTFDAASLDPVESVDVRVPAPIPYVPGFLSYREFPALEAAWDPLQRRPDVLLVDGAGILHPVHVGSATFAGLKLDVPTIGVTKSPFIAEVAGEVPQVGDTAPLLVEGRTVGYALRTRPPPVKPIYVSPGHRVGLETALALVRRLLRGHKLPEPLHLAHLAADRAKRAPG